MKELYKSDDSFDLSFESGGNLIQLKSSILLFAIYSRLVENGYINRKNIVSRGRIRCLHV